LLPDLLPGYRNVSESGLEPGLNYDQMLSDPSLDALWIVGSNPVARQTLATNAFVVVSDLFLTETARHADVVFPAASVYEKNGTVTNVTGEVQKLSRGPKTMGAKSDLEVLFLLAKEMRENIGSSKPEDILREISTSVRGYNLSFPILQTGSPFPTIPLNGRVEFESNPDLIRSTGNTLYTSGTLGRYSQMLNSVLEAPGELYRDPLKDTGIREGSVQLETQTKSQ
jgi:NADH-quinone oxidoreductase subunit G